MERLRGWDVLRGDAPLNDSRLDRRRVMGVSLLRGNGFWEMHPGGVTGLGFANRRDGGIAPLCESTWLPRGRVTKSSKMRKICGGPVGGMLQVAAHAIETAPGRDDDDSDRSADLHSLRGDGGALWCHPSTSKVLFAVNVRGEGRFSPTDPRSGHRSPSGDASRAPAGAFTDRAPRAATPPTAPGLHHGPTPPDIPRTR
jgi:hypothetical protein